MSGQGVWTTPRRGMKFAPVAATGLGDTTIIAAVEGKKLRVMNYALISLLAVSVKWKSGSTDLTGALSFGATGGIACPGSSDTVWFETNPGEPLILNLGFATTVGGHVTYFEEG